MSFWVRMFSAVVCWAASMLVLIAVASHYLPSMSQVDLLPRILWTLGVGMAGIVVLVGTLALWMGAWLGRYW